MKSIEPVPRTTLCLFLLLGLLVPSLGSAQTIHDAASKGELDAVRQMVEKEPSLINALKDSSTPLHFAAYDGRVEVVKFLVDHGANVNTRQTDGKTPLYHAAEQKRTEVALFLLVHGADPNLAGKDGRTPLHHAAWQGNVELARALLSHGARPSLRTQEGKLPLDLAIAQHQKEIVTLLRGESNRPPHTAPSFTPMDVFNAALKVTALTVQYTDTRREEMVVGPLSQVRGLWLIRLSLVNQTDTPLWVVPNSLHFNNNSTETLFVYSGWQLFDDIGKAGGGRYGQNVPEYLLHARYFSPVLTSSPYIALKPHTQTSIDLFAENGGGWRYTKTTSRTAIGTRSSAGPVVVPRTFDSLLLLRVSDPAGLPENYMPQNDDSTRIVIPLRRSKR